MLREGTVVERKSDRITVQFERPEACKQCGQCNGHRHAHRVEIGSTQAEKGDTVQVEMPEGRVVRASMLAYLLPLGCMVAGLLLAGSIQPAIAPGLSQDLFAVLCAIAGLSIAYGVMHALDRLLRQKPQWLPQIVSVTRPEEPSTQR